MELCGGNGPHVSSTQSGKWFEGQSAKSRYQQKIILKILLENVFCKQVFMSPERGPESDLRNNLPNLDISKTLFWRYFWKMCFVSKSSCLQHRGLKVISGKKFPSLNTSNFFPMTLIKYQKPNFCSHLNFSQLKIARHEIFVIIPDDGMWWI